MTIDVENLVNLLTPKKPVPKPKDGLSAYDIWLSLGNKGSEKDFLESLKGRKGQDGIIETVIKEVKVKGEKGEPGKSIKGEPGKRGLPGAKGDDGDDGNDGISVVKAHVDRHGDLIIEYSDGRIENAGHVRGADGLMTGGGGGARKYADETFLAKSLLDDKGDILTSDGTNEYVLPVSAIDGLPLLTDSTATGGLKWGYPKYTTVSTNYSVLPSDYHVEADTAGITVTLESASDYEGRSIFVDNASSGTITLTSVNAGAGSGFLLQESGDYILQEDGTSKIIVGGTANPITIVKNQSAMVTSNGSLWRLKLLGGIIPPSEITADYTVTENDRTVVANAASSIDVTLPSSVGLAGQRYAVKHTGIGTVTMKTTSSQLIDGASTVTISQGVAGGYTTLNFESDGTGWLII